MSDKFRVVLDINVLISSYFFGKPDSPPRQVFQAALDKRILLLYSSDYRTDLTDAFSKEKFIDKLAKIDETVQSIVDTIIVLGEGITPRAVPPGSVRDEDDSVILACAVGGKADFIVSGDQDLTVLKNYENIPILTPLEFLAVLNPPEETTNESSEED